MVDKGIASVFMIVGALVAFLVGRGYQKVHSAYKAWQGTKNAVGGLRKAFWAVLRGTIGLAVLTLFVLFLMGMWVAGPAFTPQSGPSPSPSPTR